MLLTILGRGNIRFSWQPDGVDDVAAGFMCSTHNALLVSVFDVVRRRFWKHCLQFAEGHFVFVHSVEPSAWCPVSTREAQQTILPMLVDWNFRYASKLYTFAIPPQVHTRVAP